MDMIAAIRRRPGMYVGATDSDGVVHLAMAAIGNAFDQHLLGRCGRIEVSVEPDGTISVGDDSPGLSVDATGSQPPLAELLTLHLGPPAAVGSLGMTVVNALSAALEIVTVHAGVCARGRWRRGQPDGAIEAAPTTAANGTLLRFTPDPAIFGDHRVDIGSLLDRTGVLVALRPGLVIDVRTACRQQEPDGLTARVRRALVPASSVAAGRRDLVTSTGPLTVDVALGWRSASSAPVVESFVNYLRSRDNGTHVDGLFVGIRRILGGNRAAHGAGLVAAVAVFLPDPRWANSTKDRLVTPSAREAVANVTAEALRTWTTANPEATATLRARISGP